MLRLIGCGAIPQPPSRAGVRRRRPEPQRLKNSIFSTARPRLLLAALRDRQRHKHEALPRLSRKKRDRRRSPPTRLRPETRKSQREPRRPSTRNPQVYVLYKCAPDLG